MVGFAGKHLFLCLVLISSLLVKCSTTCQYKARTDAPEVYWINMDKSATRKVTMEQTLHDMSLRNHRVRGLTPTEIFVPPDIEDTWRTAACKLQTDWKPPDKLSKEYLSNTNSSYDTYSQYSAFTASLCGRGKKKNNPKELGCTTSHLIAMYNAIYSTTAKSRYALIVEDDVSFPFDVDYNEMARTAPTGFGILQLFNSNEGSMEATWTRYVKNNGYVWIERHPMKYFDFWSTCAYLIDRHVMKPILDAVLSHVNGWISLKIVAGLNMNPACVPAACCFNGTEYENFIHTPPCVWAPRGYQADSFLYAMTKTYMLSMPVISNGQGGNQSTFHQDHVEQFHRKSFRRQRRYINEMLLGKVPMPSFMKPACKEAVDIDLV